jgi:tripartite-type tricarboxylate transporter receptor subunit TctC
MPRFVLLFLALLLGASAARADEPLSFKGKTITVIIGSAPGGGTDVSGRLIANFLASHLEGKPTIIVRNIAGAQGMTSMNYFVKQVAADGMTLTMGATTQADPLNYRKPNVQYDPTKFEWVGGVGRGGTVLLIRKDAEARLFDKSKPPAVMGSLGGVPRSGMQTTAWGVGFLGWNAKWVVGYPGTSELFIALERGEIDMTATANLFQVKKFLDTGDFKILTQSGALRDGKAVPRPEFGDAPVVANLISDKMKTPVEQQAYNYWSSLTALDKWIALPPGTPAPYVKAYRDAFDASFSDPEFVELGKKVSEEFEPMHAKDVKYLIDKLGETTPEAMKFIADMLHKQGLEGE